MSNNENETIMGPGNSPKNSINAASTDSLSTEGGLDNSRWLMILIVFLMVVGVTLAVMNHARVKPESPQQLVVAAFNRSFPAVNEWKPGMGPQPFIYHPAGFNSPTWQPLYACPLHGALAPNFDAAGALHCPTCNQFMVLNR